MPDRQVLRGCEDSQLEDLHLQRNPALYNFTRQGAGLNVSRGGAPWEWGWGSMGGPWVLAGGRTSGGLIQWGSMGRHWGLCVGRGAAG